MKLLKEIAFGDALLELARISTTTRVTTSRCLTARPCWVFCAIVEPDNIDNKLRAYLRNGETINNDILIALGARYAHPSHSSTVPIFFNQGLYVELNDNVTSVMVQYIERSV